jgi:integrase/recombinase XerD
MTKPISPLRQRMIDDMTMRNLSPSTHETYIRAVVQFSALHRRSPDKLGVEHLREYHLQLVSRGITANSICVKMAALRFFYGTTLQRPDIASQIPMPRRTDHLPTVLAREEVEHLLKAVPDLQSRTALITIYSAGLRISEVLRLTARDIDSARAWSSASGKAKGARIAIRSYPSSCSACFATIGTEPAHHTGCFPAAIHHGQ